MSTALITHPDFLNHLTPQGHPERVDRLRAVLAELEAAEFDALDRRAAPMADRAALDRAHDPRFLDWLEESVPASGGVGLDPDTWMSPGSWNAARRTAGAVMLGVDLVMGQEAGAAFCAVRPPGHHAKRERAMGFCLVNHAAVGALHALETHGLERVAIVDFDVHHGNGTQQIFERDGRVFYGSSHQYPFYPGTGAEHETGVGNIVNVTLAPMSGSLEFRDGWATRILPELEDFAPELVIISAGFDAHRADPLGQILLDEDDFTWITEQICGVASRCCRGRVVSTLEGGYDLGALARSTAAHLRVLMAHADG